MVRGKASNSRRISTMKNLGPACEQDLARAGITTVEQLKRLGAENAFVKMLVARKAAGVSAKCVNAAYLYALYGAIHNLDWRDLPEEKKKHFKEFTAELRAAGEFH